MIIVALQRICTTSNVSREREGENDVIVRR